MKALDSFQFVACATLALAALNDGSDGMAFRAVVFMWLAYISVERINCK